MNVTVYGSASDRIDKVYFDRVEELGRRLALSGNVLVFGAGAGGLMGAVARGFSSVGGRIIGVAPHFMHDREPIYDGCTELIHTETMSERKDKMEKLADAFIILPGGIGTFDEFFQILTLKDLGRVVKPIVLFNVNGFWDGMLSVIGSDYFKGFIRTAAVKGFCVCETFESVLEAISEENDVENGK